MRLSLSHQFLFVHIPKTAGTTINLLLDPYCVQSKEKTLLSRVLSKIPFPENPNEVLLRPHDSARWARVKLGAAKYNELTSFAFVRNPFDLVVSRYEFVRQKPWHHRHERVKNITFSEFLDMEKKRNLFQRRDQFSFISDISGNIIVDDIYRFENLQNDVLQMTQKLGIEMPTKLAHRHKLDRKPYRDYYQGNDIEKTAALFERDIKAFGYEF